MIFGSSCGIYLETLSAPNVEKDSDIMTITLAVESARAGWRTTFGMLAAGRAMYDEPVLSSTLVRTARRRLVTHIRGPGDDVPRGYGRTRVKIRRTEQDSSVLVMDEAHDIVKRPTAAFGRIDSGTDLCVEITLEAFYVLVVEDQPCLQPDGHIWKHRSLAEAEHQPFLDARDSTNDGDFSLDAVLE